MHQFKLCLVKQKYSAGHYWPIFFAHSMMRCRSNNFRQTKIFLCSWEGRGFLLSGPWDAAHRIHHSASSKQSPQILGISTKNKLAINSLSENTLSSNHTNMYGGPKDLQTMSVASIRFSWDGVSWMSYWYGVQPGSGSPIQRERVLTHQTGLVHSDAQFWKWKCVSVLGPRSIATYSIISQWSLRPSFCFAETPLPLASLAYCWLANPVWWPSMGPF